MTKLIGTRLISVMALLGCLALAPVQAQDNAEPAPERAQGNQAQGNSAQDSHAQSQTQASPPPSRRPAPTFTPSERIRADTSVTFPADI